MNGNKRRSLRFFLNILVLISLIVVDQMSKHLVVINLKDSAPIKIIDGVFELHYLENRGAAFGMLQNQKVFFIIIATVMLLAIFYVLVRLPISRKYTLLDCCLILIAAGAVGNMIDRVMNNYVVDFFYFSLIDFPIFNMADIYVTISCIILVLAVLFYYKESDFAFLKKGYINEDEVIDGDSKEN